MKILWITNLPSPYRMRFFNALGKECELTVLFECDKSDERDKSWSDFSVNTFTAIFMKGKKLGVSTAFCPEVIKYINKSFDHIVVTNFSDPTGIFAISYMKIKKIAYEIESDGGFPGKHTGLKASIKRYCFSGAELLFSTAKAHDEYYLSYGGKIDQIMRYPFTSIGEGDVLNEPLSLACKNKIRNKLHITEKYVVLAIGQFIYRKGFDVLLRCGEQLGNEVGIYIVGGKPTEEYINIANGDKKIHFIEFKGKNELCEYFKSADVFVLPTREDIWGLVINEAMANGLPVITTERCVAGLELVHNGENGYLVPVDDVAAIGKAINNTLYSDAYSAMCENSLNVIRNYTIEKMALQHLRVWNRRVNK